MNQFWWGFVSGGIVIPFFIIIVWWAILGLYPMVARKVVRKFSKKYHLSLNPKGVKKPRIKLDPVVDSRSPAYGDV